MNFKNYTFHLPLLLALLLSACVAKEFQRTEEQINSEIIELKQKCKEGDQKSCIQVSEEKKNFYQLYGCHCAPPRPADHPPVR